METSPVNTIPDETSAEKPRRAGKSPQRTQLDPQQWVDAATDVLANEGIGGVRIEVLAKLCGVTKGSFYWHFRDRQALLEAMLEAWKQGRLRDIERITSVSPEQAEEQLSHVIEVYGASRNRKGMAIELAMRDWARHDPVAARVVESVDLYRLECTCRLFRASGLSEPEAKSRSLLLYACVFGLSLMHCEGFDDDLGSLKQRIAQRIVGA